MRLKVSSILVFFALLTVAVAGCGGGGGQPEQQGSNGGEAAQETTQGGQGTTTQASRKLEVARGTIEEIDPEGGTMTLQPKDGEPLSFTFDPERIKVRVDREDASLQDIQTGQRVVVRYRDNRA